MRNLSILLCIILCLNACKKSAENLPFTPAALSGTWYLHTATSMTYTSGVPSNIATITYTEGVGFSNLDPGIYFKDDLAGCYLQPGLTGLPFTYVISSDHLTLKISQRHWFATSRSSVNIFYD